jgi:UDP-2,3-diacylglucosamine pyrophosphatase LpxH
MKILRAILPPLLAAFTGAASAGSALFAEAPAPPAGTRSTILISDLHLGMGRVPAPEGAASAAGTGDWHPMEDFRWFDQFNSFLDKVESTWTRRKKPVDLVILGDFLELWQSPSALRDCIYDRTGNAMQGAIGPFLDLVEVQSNLSCTADHALRRARRVIEAHQDVLKRIGRFATLEDNRVTIVPGNHDAALVFDGVRQALLDAIGAPDDRVRVATEGYWRSRDGKVFAEHGHFIEGDVNDYTEFPVTCTDVQGTPVACNGKTTRAYLQRPWGEKFVQDFYDRYEEHFPIVDNITSEAAGAAEAIAASDGLERVDAIGRALRFLLLQQSFRQFGKFLGDAKGPGGARMLGGGAYGTEWDLAAIRLEGDVFYEKSLAPSNPLRDEVQRLRTADQLPLRLSDLSEPEILQICDMRAAQHEAATAAEASPELCPGNKKLGALATKLLTSYPQRLANRMEAVRRALPADRSTRDFGVYVYAHTHAVHGACAAHDAAGSSSITADGKPWTPRAINTGAWQRVVSPQRFQAMKKEKPMKPLQDYRPDDDLPACFSMVVVTPAKEGPSAEAWFWARSGPRGNWNFHMTCPEDPWQVPGNPCMN